ncbi:MAG: hypothetical protein A3I68_00105 [Candidatus Melainabacteria bacterium RIFCSPLOWO2_02_FULL_35_15]|nr:MAG: hypothetical protein A3F80_00885 [Candidatus Melainabacteria bacterium RIFCSPLOWO2_12_FULL_35_11]OGI14826.1 MAG: hypothetical protein A3I68_00105 [Candidatus Melainabacteria bacterium RIFCSPLOWO2_02_FULL_35_15]
MNNLLDNSSRIALDTSIFIYYIEKNKTYFDLLKTIFERSRQSNSSLKIITSNITLIEVLTKPFFEKREDLANKYKDILLASEEISILELNNDIAELTAKLKSKYSFLKTPDAIQIATSIYTNADLFLSNDKKLQGISEIKVVVLDQLLINK